MKHCGKFRLNMHASYSNNLDGPFIVINAADQLGEGVRVKLTGKMPAIGNDA